MTKSLKISHKSQAFTEGDSEDCVEESKNRSKSIVETAFPRSLGITVIGQDRVILADNDNDGKRLFRELLEKLCQLDQASKNLERTKRTLVWLLDAKRMFKEGVAKKELRLLQKCMGELSGETRAWVAERAVVAIANAHPQYIRLSILGNRAKLKLYNSKRDGCSATRLFENVDRYRDENGDEILTVFLPDTANNDGWLYVGHQMQSGSSFPVGIERSKISGVRSDHLATFHRILPNGTRTKVNNDVVSKLFKEGFLIFQFEDFLNI